MYIVYIVLFICILVYLYCILGFFRECDYNILFFLIGFGNLSLENFSAVWYFLENYYSIR